MKHLSGTPSETARLDIKVEPSADVKIGTPIRITAQNPIAYVDMSWHWDGGDGFGVFPPEWTDLYTLHAKPDAYGQYTVIAIGSASDGKQSRGVAFVTVGNGESELSKIGRMLRWFVAKGKSLFGGHVLGYALVIAIALAVGHGSCKLPEFPPIPWLFPVPVPPTPQPSPAPPVKVDYIHVMLIRDPTKPLTKEQTDIFTSGEISKYLESKHLDSRRVYGPDDDLKNEEEAWKAMYARPRASLPWIAVYTAKSFHESPLPGNIAETLDLIRKIGDQ